jgi:hypothetical protein
MPFEGKKGVLLSNQVKYDYILDPESSKLHVYFSTKPDQVNYILDPEKQLNYG